MSSTGEEPRPLISDLQRLYDQLEKIKTEAQVRLPSLSEAALNWSPDRNRWSVAQCLDHLHRTGMRILPRLNEAITQLQSRDARSEGPFRYSLMERFFIRILSPNPPFRVPVPPMYVPAESESLKDAVSPFLSLQELFKECIQRANGYDLAAVRVVSPASSAMKLRLGAWLEALVAHERYHWLQVRELLAHPQFPK